MVAVRESRRIQREGWPVEVHLAALDGDMDDLYAALAEIKTAVAGVRAVLTGLLVTIAGGAIVGALNVIFKTI